MMDDDGTMQWTATAMDMDDGVEDSVSFSASKAILPAKS